VPVRVAGNAAGMRPGKGRKTCSSTPPPSLSVSFFPRPFSSWANRASSIPPQRPADKGGYGLRIPSSPNTPIAGAVSPPPPPPRIITGDKGKKGKPSAAGTECNFRSSRLVKYRLPHCLLSLFRDVYPDFLPADYVARFPDRRHNFSGGTRDSSEKARPPPPN